MDDQDRLLRGGQGVVLSCSLSVDVWQMLVVPIEVAASVEPILGAGVYVGAQLEPPGWHNLTQI